MSDISTNYEIRCYGEHGTRINYKQGAELVMLDFSCLGAALVWLANHRGYGPDVFNRYGPDGAPRRFEPYDGNNPNLRTH